MSDVPLSIWRGDSLPRPEFAATVRVSKEALDKALVEVARRRGDVRAEEILTKSRLRRIAHARQEVMWILRSATWADGSPRHSLTAIGAALGGLDHTTVLYGVNAHAARLAAQ